MRSSHTILASALSVALAIPALGQGSFQNLDFESAQLPVVPSGQPGADASVASALPGWHVFIGTDEFSAVRHNNPTIGSAAITILGPDYGYTLQGSFTPVLQAGRAPSGTGLNTSVAIAQSGFVPADARSMTFITGPFSHDFTVSFGANVLSCHLLSASSASRLYGVDVSLLAGQFGELRFTSLIPALVPFNNLYLDQIGFSAQPIPEPDVLSLLCIGAALARWHLLRGCRG
ncbi:MAG TPA: hypothetical protein VI136_01110 [Verrucomicrobiae bacterium]